MARAMLLPATAVGLLLLLRARPSAAAPPSKGFPPSLTPGCLPPAAGKLDVFCPGQHGYGCFKIPTLLRIPHTQRLLAFIEARKFSCDDHGWVDLLLRTSEDAGATWHPAAQTVPAMRMSELRCATRVQHHSLLLRACSI